jgi:hypothetical protein
MHSPSGRRIPLSLPRRFVSDLLHFARKVPSVPVQRRLLLDRVRFARERAAGRPSWCAVFLKAYGLVAAELPELRRAYLPWPWPHLYEHAVNVASVAIGRAYRGEPAVFPAHFRQPERQSLVQLDAHLRYYKEAPVEGIGLYRRALLVSRLLRPLRRLLWWVGLNSSGAKRARRMGTFALSVYSGLGAESLHPLTPLTTTLNYGVVGEDGQVDVRLVYDHRVLDGATVAHALALLEDKLNGAILAELQAMQTLVAA